MLQPRDKRKYDTRVDVWSLGVLIYEMVTKRVPFEGRDQADTIRKIKRNDLNYPSQFPNKAKDLVSKLLKQDPEIRMKLSKVCQHIFVTSQEIIRPVHENIKENAKLPLIEIEEVEESDDDTNTDEIKYKNPDRFKKFKPDVNKFKDNEGVVLSDEGDKKIDKNDAKSQNSNDFTMSKVLEKFARMERDRVSSATMIQNKVKNYEDTINSIKTKVEELNEYQSKKYNNIDQLKLQLKGNDTSLYKITVELDSLS